MGQTKQQKERKQIFEDATAAFKAFNLYEMEPDEFERQVHELISRTVAVYELTEQQADWFRSDFDKQLSDYMSGQTSHTYLMSPTSSGSFLQQFDPANGPEIEEDTDGDK